MARWQEQTWRTKTVSEFYELGLDQASLDFVDVDVVADTRLFVDPRALRLLEKDNPWAADCAGMVRDYFTAVLKAVKANDRKEGLRLLHGLHEPNDTRLGMSRRQAKGRGVGNILAGEMWESLRGSDAARTGLIEDLEDSALLIEGIGADRISDITTNIIRAPLVAFTQDMCERHGIPIEPTKVDAVWDADKGDWILGADTQLPVPVGRPLLLVPKNILRTRLDFDPPEYYRYVMRWLHSYELSRPNSELVYLIRGVRKVDRKELARKYRNRWGSPKRLVASATKTHPEIIRNYRADKEIPERRRQPPTYGELTQRTRSEPLDWNELLDAVTEVKRGPKGASAYHKAVFALMSALFYPDLDMGEQEVNTHRGKKRLDIRFVNMTGGKGFFAWVAMNYGEAPYVTVECKNYTGDPENPELDQLLGRFTKLNGKVGLLACRKFKDRKKFLASCTEAAKGGQGFVLPLDDDDLAALVEARKADDQRHFNNLLFNRFRAITT